MNHPKREEWVPFLYGETTPAAHRQLKAHLRECPECRAEIETWNRTVNRLEAWKMPSVSGRHDWLAPAFKWAAAAILMLATGFGIGRVMGEHAMEARMRARLEPQLHQEMARMVRQEVERASGTVLTASAEQTERLLAAYNTLQETRRGEDMDRLYVAIKKQLDTVAINTQQGLVQLANYRAPAPDASKP
jgi:hypothetical protein